MNTKQSKYRKIVASFLLAVICLLPFFEKKNNGNIKKIGIIQINSRILSSMSNEKPYNILRSFFSNDMEFNDLVDRWVEFEKSVYHYWGYMEDCKYNDWYTTLYEALKKVQKEVNDPMKYSKSLCDWHDLVKKISQKKHEIKRKDDQLLKKIMNKLKKKVLNKQVINWENDVEGIWEKVLKGKLNNNTKLTKVVRDECQNWVTTQLMA
ncbi:Plasmodium exported protein, unknown function [Plasmodium berghei]|uniref:Plasmodium RESA N-terminal domain-containing protein n=2 Tax=Plasmodium berghei TaxID=5821 RepID=A0A509AJY1_PLABA|nr:Plasmodium exported protein, unknown function [Plasmodium berghei ANKA]CXI22371.1 Plasmodium exported protein, unknown function [Plasmodium berghei]SBW38289.1 Plasmodium exported protein, unknown function [Plasmodium berghei]SCL85251.1 Plasmodium exported protein, unknown function [Plasmodium berghei]SCL85695.1 Plasmodium exported protein, unknown function [Plasmodium berghei]VUC54934.1 Plasmodium exported protein, unknown function [Plasmodium berghei ANKA]|eukprot:XP_034420754.1 Plasmodium exported protein, unknown function [Plasmodium berghei ANKA]